MTADEADLWLIHSPGDGAAETATRLYSLTEAVWGDPLNDLSGFGMAFVFNPTDCRYESAEAMLITCLTELCCRCLSPAALTAMDDGLKCLDMCRSLRIEDLFTAFVDIVTEILAFRREQGNQRSFVVVLGNLDGTIRNGSWLFRMLTETIIDYNLNLKIVITSGYPGSLTSQSGPVKISRPTWASPSVAVPASEKHSAATEEGEINGQQDSRAEEHCGRISPTPVLKDVLALIQDQPQLHSYIDTLILLGQSCLEDAKLWQLITNWFKIGRFQPAEEGESDVFMSQLVQATPEKIFQSILASVSSPTKPWLTRALGQVLFAFRPLTLSEFSDLDDPERSKDTFKKTTVERDSHGLLMVHVLQRQEIQLTHPGLRKYLETSRDGALGGWFHLPSEPSIHKHLAESCLNYLTCTSTHRLREDRTSEAGSWHMPFERRDNLLSYAVKYWLRHAMLAVEEQVFESDACKRFMADDEAVRQWAVMYRALSPPLANQQSDTTPPADALLSLVIFAEHGAQDLLASTMQKHQKLGTPGFEAACFAALLAAAGHGNIQMAKDAKLTEGPPPKGETLDQLILAALESDDADAFGEVFGMARQYPEKIRDTDNLLARAASLGRTAAVKDLLGILEHPKETAVDTSDKLSALSYACQRGFVDVVDLLIREGGPSVLAELRQDGASPMPIKLAVKLGRLDIFTSLGASTIPQKPRNPDAIAFYRCVIKESSRYGRHKPIQSVLADIKRRLSLTSDGSADDTSPGSTEGNDTSNMVDYLTKHIIGCEEYGKAVKDAIRDWKHAYDLLDLLTQASDKLGEDEFASVFANWMGEAANGNDLRLVKLVFENGAKSPWATTEALKSAATIAFQIALGKGDNGALCMPYLIDKGADITSRGPDLRTPLFRAAYFGQRKVVEALIAARVDVNAKGDDDWYPLHACYDNAAITRMLVENHADVNKLTEDGSPLPALAFAVRWEGSEVVDELLKGNSSRETLQAGLQEALERQKPEMAEKLIPYCPGPSYLRVGNDFWQNLVWTPNVKLVEWLLSYPYRIDPNKKGEDGRAALHYISGITTVDIIKMLVTCGADIEATDKKGQTPLIQAIHSSNWAAVRYLVEECGALITNGSSYYGSPLQAVCHLGTLDIVKLLYNTKAGPAELDRIERGFIGTALQAALQRREETDEKHAIVRFLVEEAKANVNLASSFWGSALHLACLSSTPDIMRLLLNHDAVVDARDHADRTPLHFALYRTQEHVELLLEKGADLDAVDILNRNALHIAVLSGRLDLVRFVLDKRPGFVVGRT